jgi:hypothetical protein
LVERVYDEVVDTGRGRELAALGKVGDAGHPAPFHVVISDDVD